MEEDPVTPLAMAARASARSASFDIELGEARGGFAELRISEEEEEGEEVEEEEEEEATPAPSTPSLPRPRRRLSSAAPPPPPFASFDHLAPLSPPAAATATMLMKSRRQASAGKEGLEGRYHRSPSPPPPPPSLSSSFSLSTPPQPPRKATATRATSRCALDDPPFDHLDPSEEGSTTFFHLPRDLQLRILSLVPERNNDKGASPSSLPPDCKRSASLSCRLFRDLLLDGQAWPRVDLSPVTARSAAWLARRAGGGGGGSGSSSGGSYGCLEEGGNKRAAQACSSSSPPPSSSSSSALSLSSSSSGIREVALRPSTEQQAVLFNDVFLATAPGIASLTLDTPWHAATLTNFSLVFWALKLQRSLRHLKVKVQEVDFDALPPNLESLEVECSRFARSSRVGGRKAGEEEEAGGDEEEEEEAGGGEEEEEEDEETAATTAAAAALPSLELDETDGGDDRRHREDRAGLRGLSRLTRLRHLELAVWSHGAPWQDLSPLLSLTGLRSLSLNTHPFEGSKGGSPSSSSSSPSSSSSAAASSSPSSVNDFTWSRLGSTTPDLRCLTISAAPGFDAALPALPPYCDLRFFTRGGFRESLARSYAANLVSLELKDLALPRFDARVLAPCRRLASLDVSFAADAGVVEGLEAVAGSLRCLKTGCPALRLVLPPLPRLEELEAVAFHDLDLSVDRAACAALCGGRLRSVYLAALDFGSGMHVFVHEAGKRGLDLRFATRPLRAVFTPDQLPAMDLDGNGVEVVG